MNRTTEKLAVELPFDALYRWYSVANTMHKGLIRHEKSSYCFMTFSNDGSFVCTMTYKSKTGQYFSMSIPAVAQKEMPVFDYGIRMEFNKVALLFKTPKKYKGDTVLLVFCKEGVLGHIVEGFTRSDSVRHFHTYLVAPERIEESTEVLQCVIPSSRLLLFKKPKSPSPYFTKYQFSQESLSYHSDFYIEANKVEPLRFKDLSPDNGIYITEQAMSAVFAAADVMQGIPCHIGFSKQFVRFEFPGEYLCSIRVAGTVESSLPPAVGQNLVWIKATRKFYFYVREISTKYFNFVRLRLDETLPVLHILGVPHPSNSQGKYARQLQALDDAEITLCNPSDPVSFDALFSLKMLKEVLHRISWFDTNIAIYESGILVSQGTTQIFLPAIPS